LLIGLADKWQQRQMTRAFDLARQAALAAGAVSGLAAWTDFSGFSNEAAERFYVFIIETFTFRAIFNVFLAASAAATSPIIAPIAVIVAPAGAVRTSASTAITAVVIHIIHIVEISVAHQLFLLLV
jgi:hypothetical protein